MVGIVIVSHSHSLAKGVAELAAQMTQNQCNIAIAGGIDDAEYPIGTDCLRVMNAIEQVHDTSGVLVLMDLGSALLSAEMALELLPAEIANGVELCSAPLVEGAVAAAVAAAANLSIAEVKAEAMGALAGKQCHLDEVYGQTTEPILSDIMDKGITILSEKWQVKNPHGMHARPSAVLVAAMGDFDAVVELVLEKQTKRANAKSINSIAKLNIKCHDEICLCACGDDAEQAVARFIELANDHFGEHIGTEHHALENADIGLANTTPADMIADGVVQTARFCTGIAASGGIVSGPVVHFNSAMPAIPSRQPETLTVEIARLELAIQWVITQLKQQIISTERSLGKAHAGIFVAHVMMLSDPELLGDVKQRLSQNIIAEQAWLDAGRELMAEYCASDRSYMRERAADIGDLTRQVLQQLTGTQALTLELSQPSIILAVELSPSDAARLDPTKVLAICLGAGGKTAHSVILAKAMGIPAIVQLGQCLTHVKPGQQVTVDGFSGLLWLTPSADELQSLQTRRLGWLQQRASQQSVAHQAAVTLDGQTFKVTANIASAADLPAIVAAGADGVGLLRTELLFHASPELPTEQQQYLAYREIADALAGQVLTIRSFDIGGDKPLLCYPMSQEDNPFLGLRGIRLCLADPELFKTQLRAILRVAAEFSTIQLMVPMVSQAGEIRAVRTLIDQCRRDLNLAEQDSPLPIGIMIEVPAAVLNAAELAELSDFFSIGTNDLTQYIMAADRGNSKVAELVDYQQPALLKAIAMTCAAAQQANIPVSMCGEMAGDTEMTALLLGLGVTKLSACASMIPGVKAKIRQLDLEKAVTKR
jgi:phosphoenolpyruvate-protein phosphotransferase/dihydroxyacetone kinase phosphotransfer subunit